MNADLGAAVLAFIDLAIQDYAHNARHQPPMIRLGRALAYPFAAAVRERDRLSGPEHTGWRRMVYRGVPISYVPGYVVEVGDATPPTTETNDGERR